MPLKEIDRDVEVLTASSLLSRLWHIEADIKYMKENIEDLDNSYQDIETRLDELEESKMGQVVTEDSLALSKIKERIAIMQEKIDGID